MAMSRAEMAAIQRLVALHGKKFGDESSPIRDDPQLSDDEMLELDRHVYSWSLNVPHRRKAVGFKDGLNRKYYVVFRNAELPIKLTLKHLVSKDDLFRALDLMVLGLKREADEISQEEFWNNIQRQENT